MKHLVKRNQFVNIRLSSLSCFVHLSLVTVCLQVLLDATKPQDGVNGNAEGLHGAEGGESGRAGGSEVSSD